MRGERREPNKSISDYKYPLWYTRTHTRSFFEFIYKSLCTQEVKTKWDIYGASMPMPMTTTSTRIANT